MTPAEPGREMDGLEAMLPKHAGGLHLTHNEHHGLYEPIERHIADCQLREDFVSDEEYGRAVATDSLWVIQWYPDTPVGFYRVAASSLGALLRALGEDEDGA